MMGTRRVPNLGVLREAAAIEGQNAIVSLLSSFRPGLHHAITAPVATADATDEATAIILANAIRSTYLAHAADAEAHLEADATNVLTEPAASNAATLYAALNEIKSVLNAGHFVSQAPHVTPVPSQLFALDDLRFPANTIDPPGGALDDADIDATTGLLLFDDGPDPEYTAITAQMPHKWAAGTVIEPHVHWLQRAAGNVVWRLDYQILGVGSTVATFPLYGQLESSASIFSWQSGVLHNLTPLGTIDMSGFGESTMIAMRLSRQGGNPLDTLTGDAELLEFDIHYRIDKAGTFDASPAEAGVFPLGIPGARAITAIDADSTARAVVLANEIKSRLNEHLSSGWAGPALDSIVLVDS